jgi:hypothetical protein
VKVAIIHTLLVAAAAAQSPVAGTEPKRVPMREVVTHDDIVEAAREAKKSEAPPQFKPAEGPDPSVANRPKSILSRSDILCYRGQAALVPKRAVLHIPKQYEDRLGMQEGSRLGSWSDFAKMNRAWIRTVAVTRAQAEGREPMDEATLKSFEKETRVVVATYQEGPISVTPLRVPPPAAPGVPATPGAVRPPTAATPAESATPATVAKP